MRAIRAADQDWNLGTADLIDRVVKATGVEALIGEVEAPAKAEAGVVKIVGPTSLSQKAILSHSQS
jgi:hypothetical protein